MHGVGGAVAATLVLCSQGRWQCHGSWRAVSDIELWWGRNKMTQPWEEHHAPQFTADSDTLPPYCCCRAVRELAPPGDVATAAQKPLQFEFRNVEMSHDSFRGLQVRCRWDKGDGGGGVQCVCRAYF